MTPAPRKGDSGLKSDTLWLCAHGHLHGSYHGIFALAIDDDFDTMKGDELPIILLLTPLYDEAPLLATSTFA